MTWNVKPRKNRQLVVSSEIGSDSLRFPLILCFYRHSSFFFAMPLIKARGMGIRGSGECLKRGPLLSLENDRNGIIVGRADSEACISFGRGNKKAKKSGGDGISRAHKQRNNHHHLMQATKKVIW